MCRCDLIGTLPTGCSQGPPSWKDIQQTLGFASPTEAAGDGVRPLHDMDVKLAADPQRGGRQVSPAAASFLFAACACYSITADVLPLLLLPLATLLFAAQPTRCCNSAKLQH